MRVRALPVAAVLLVVAVLLAAAFTRDREPASDPTVGQVVTVGVRDGDSIPDYLRASRDELSTVGASEMYALVSFTGYLAPDPLATTLDGVGVAQVLARVPLPETQTEIVHIPASRIPADVTAGMAEVAARKASEADEYRRQAAGVAGADQQDRRELYASGARVAAAEANAYREHCSCVYAAVVRATTATLARLATRPQVRVVDPAPEVRRLDRSVFLPPLPEQQDLVRPPADREIGSP